MNLQQIFKQAEAYQFNLAWADIPEPQRARMVKAYRTALIRKAERIPWSGTDGVKEGEAYERKLKRAGWTRYKRELKEAVDGARDGLDASNRIKAVRPMDPNSLLIRNHFNEIRKAEQAALADFLEKQFGIKLDGWLDDIPLEKAMRKRIAENIDLIGGLGRETKNRLSKNIYEAFKENPYDRKAAREIFATDERIADNRLRLITRDQTSKAIGQIDQIQQTSAGVNKYIWRTMDDERVRPSHRALSGQVFSWDSPPPEGHPKQPIQCRCYAEPVWETE